jgi:hypothetical protein
MKKVILCLLFSILLLLPGLGSATPANRDASIALAREIRQKQKELKKLLKKVSKRERKIVNRKLRTLPDTDDDGASDVYEQSSNSNQCNDDSDGDGVSDGDEVSGGSNPGNGSDSQETKDEITAKTAESLTVGTTVYAIVDSTRFLDDNKNPTTYDAFTVGQCVEVEGRLVSGVLTASKVKPDDDCGSGVSTSVKDVVANKSDTSLTVGTTEFVINLNETVFLNNNGQVVGYNLITIGACVEVEGRLVGGVLTADKVKLDDDCSGGGEFHSEVKDLVSAKTPSSITVGTTEFQVNGATTYLDDDNNPINFGDIGIGDCVEAEGDSVAGILTADKIKLDNDCN